MTTPFFTAADFFGIMGDDHRVHPTRAAERANAKLAGKVVVDATEWEELMRMKKRVDERTVFVADTFKDEIARLRDNEAELESLRALKAQVDAAPVVYGIVEIYDNVRFSTERRTVDTHTAKLVQIKEIEEKGKK